jgi:haloacetate dehalogenase
MPDLADLFPGYESRWIETSGGRIFARVSNGGDPPLLLLHGHPQSNVMWHRHCFGAGDELIRNNSYL